MLQNEDEQNTELPEHCVNDKKKVCLVFSLGVAMLSHKSKRISNIKLSLECDIISVIIL